MLISEEVCAVKLKQFYENQRNIKSVIKNHNANLLSNYTIPVPTCSCSCLHKSECLLNNECLSESVLYIAVISKTSSQINKYYDYETCEKTFKEWCNNHIAIFLNLCKQKRDLCLTEKLTIPKIDPSSQLNTRDEFISKCRNMNTFTLKASKSVHGNHVAIVRIL